MNQIEAEIKKVDMLPLGAYISSIEISRDETNTYFQCRVTIRGETVKRGPYADYFRNHLGKLQCMMDTYVFRWSDGTMPELVIYRVGSSRKIHEKKNPENKYFPIR